MKLSEMICRLKPMEIHGTADCEITGVNMDSRLVRDRKSVV